MGRLWWRLLMPFRTIRFRLAIQYLLALSVILVIVCVIVLRSWEAHIREEFDRLLAEEADTFEEYLGADVESASPLASARRRTPPMSRLAFLWLFCQVVTEDASVVWHSENIDPGALPFTPAARSATQAGQACLETITVEPDALPLAQSRRLRLLTRRLVGTAGGRYYLQVAGSLYPVEASVRRLRDLFVTIIPVGLAVASAASWLLAGRALAPIGDIVRQTRQYSAAHLDQRIKVRPGHDELSQLVKVINRMLDRLEAAFRAQEQFIANASHELKTPLSVLLAEAQILDQRARLPEEYNQFVTSVQDQLRQLSRLTDSLLTLARADAGFPLSRVEPVSLNDVVIESVQRCEPLARQRMVRLVPRLALPTERGVEPVIAGDRNLLRTVIENLVRNAVRYSPLEGTVEIEVALGDTAVAVIVRDSGPGIPPDRIDRVFNRFFQLPRGDRSVHAAGLGLAIAKSVTQLHDGSISVRNRPSGGCEFTVRLPLKPLQERTA